VSREDQERALELMPRDVRDKLDRVRIKLHLREWQALTLAERAQIRDLPCASEPERTHYAAEVDRLVRRVTGSPAERLREV
jgi:Conserved nitrate reductase-associated protein (Nitr_red_assoc)